MMIPPRGFKQALVVLLVLVGMMLYIGIVSGLMPAERVDQLRQLILFWR